MKKQIISIVLLAVLSAFTASAQTRHEFSVSAGGGLSTLLYDLSEGDTKLGFGGTAGLGYTFFFSPNWGLGTGAELSLYTGKGTYDNFLSSYKATDIAGTSYEQRYLLNNFEEKQQALFVNTPLMLQYQTNGKNTFYVALGGRLGIPVNVKYKTNGSNIISAGYFAGQNVEYSTQEFLGFGTLQGQKSDNKTDLKLSVMGSLETGVKWRLSEKTSLYTGIYCDYGLNDIADPDNASFVARKGTEKIYATNSILSSQYGSYNAQTGAESATVMAEKIRPMTVGLKLRLSFGAGSLDKEKVPKEKKRKQKKEEKIVMVEEIIEVKKPIADTQTEEEDEAARQAAEAKAKAQAEQAYIEAKKEIASPVKDYDKGGVTLTASQKAGLDKKATLLKQYPNLKVTCEGHTCDIGTEEINMRVGLQRAEAAKAYLVSQGISASRIQTTSKGAADPIVPNTSEENRRQNRRVEVIVTE